MTCVRLVRAGIVRGTGHGSGGSPLPNIYSRAAPPDRPTGRARLLPCSASLPTSPSYLPYPGRRSLISAGFTSQNQRQSSSSDPPSAPRPARRPPIPASPHAPSDPPHTFRPRLGPPPYRQPSHPLPSAPPRQPAAVSPLPSPLRYAHATAASCRHSSATLPLPRPPTLHTSKFIR